MKVSPCVISEMLCNEHSIGYDTSSASEAKPGGMYTILRPPPASFPHPDVVKMNHAECA